MNWRQSEIKIIGYVLALLYAISFLAYYNFYQFVTLNAPDVQAMKLVSLSVIATFFAILFVGSIAVAQLKEWGRIVIVSANLMMGIYLAIPYINPADILPLSYIIMNVVIFLYFIQDKVKSRFNMIIDGKWRSILVIDDDETLLKTIRPILISKGYSVLTAMTGEDGLQAAKKHKPDLIILDVILPGIKGRDVCRKIKEDKTTTHIPVVFLTSKSSESDIEAELDAGAITHLTKPVNATILSSTVRNILDAESKDRPEWRSILVIDDDLTYLTTLRQSLLSHGYSVLTASSGEEGLAIAKKQKPELILLDVIMPGLKGREVCEKLKEGSETVDIPVVFLTAKNSPDDIKAELEVGAVTHLTKPVDTKELISTISNILHLQS